MRAYVLQSHRKVELFGDHPRDWQHSGGQR